PPLSAARARSAATASLSASAISSSIPTIRYTRTGRRMRKDDSCQASFLAAPQIGLACDDRQHQARCLPRAVVNRLMSHGERRVGVLIGSRVVVPIVVRKIGACHVKPQ